MEFYKSNFMYDERGFTLPELLVVATIIAILLAISIPNLLKARISANHASARKSIQTLRDAEYEFFEGDLDNDGLRDFTNIVGDNSTPASLICPGSPPCDNLDALVDDNFIDMETVTPIADCLEPRSGYCLYFTEEIDVGSLDFDFGWELSPASVHKSGRFDFIGFADGTIRCTASTVNSWQQGQFQGTRATDVCFD